MMKGELKKVNSSIEYVLNKSDELSSRVSNSSDTSASKSFENDINEKISLINSKTSELEKRHEDLCKKSDVWDRKPERTELNEIRSELKAHQEKADGQLRSVNQEVEGINKMISLNSEAKTAETDETISKSLETKLTTNMAQIENKMAIQEAARKDINTKLSDLSEKQHRLNEEFGCISELKAKLNSKSSVWDSKADMKNVESLLQSEVKKLKQDQEFVLNKADGIEFDVRNIKDNLPAIDNISNVEGKLVKIEDKVKVVDVLLNDVKIFKEKMDKNEAISSDIKALKEKLSAIDRLETINKDVIAIKEKMATLDIKNLNEKIKSIDKIETVNKDVTAIKENVANLDIKNLNEKIKSIDKIDVLNRDFQSLSEKIKSQFESELRTLRERVESLNLSDIKSQLASEVKSLLANEITKVNDKISCLDTKQKDQTNINISNKDKDTMESSLRALEDKVKTDKESLRNMENKLNSLDVNSIVKKEDLSGFLGKEEVGSFVKKEQHGSDLKQLQTVLQDEITKLQKNLETSKSQQNSDSKLDEGSLNKKFISKADFTVLGKILNFAFSNSDMT